MEDLTHDTPLGDVQSKLIELGDGYDFVMEEDGSWEIRDCNTDAVVERGQL